MTSGGKDGQVSQDFQSKIGDNVASATQRRRTSNHGHRDVEQGSVATLRRPGRRVARARTSEERTSWMEGWMFTTWIEGSMRDEDWCNRCAEHYLCNTFSHK